MPGVSGDEFEGVEQDRREGLKTLRDAARRPGQVHDQASSPDAANAPGERREGRFVEPAKPDQLGEPRRLPVDHPPRGLGGDVPGPEPGPPGGDHQVRPRGREQEDLGDPVLLVGDHQRPVDFETQVLEGLPCFRPGEVLPFPKMRGIAHGDDHGGFSQGYQEASTTPRFQAAHDRRFGVILWLLAVLALVQPAVETYSLRAVVSDAKDAAIRDLETSDVSLTVGGATVPLTRFEKDERPARVALVIDSSQPLQNAYRLQFNEAAKEFIASLPSNTRVNVWTTGDRPTKVIDNLDVAEEGSALQVSRTLSRTASMGGNTILDALIEAAEDLKKQEGERSILVFLTGQGAGFSNDSRQGVVDRVLKTGVEVTGTLVAERGEATGGGDVTPADYDYVFGTLTERTGGRLERPLSVMAASTATRRVAADLRSTYRVAFHFSGKRPGKIALQVARPSVKVRLSTAQKETSSP